MAAAAPVLAPRLPSVALLPVAAPAEDVPVADFLLSMILDSDTSTQVRDQGLDEKAVLRYLEALQADPPEELPPVDLRLPPGERKALVGDGFHRVEAYRRAGRFIIKARVRPGGREDAILDGIDGNRKHGLAMGDDDRRKAVKLLLCGKKFAAGELAQAEIARRVGISPSVVSELVRTLTIQGRIVPPAVRTTKGGRTINTAKIGRTRAAARAERPAVPSVEDAADDEETEATTEATTSPTAEAQVMQVGRGELHLVLPGADKHRRAQCDWRPTYRSAGWELRPGKLPTCPTCLSLVKDEVQAEAAGYRKLLDGEEGEALAGKPRPQAKSPSLTKLQALEAQVMHLGESGDPAWRRRVAQVMRQAAEQLQPLQGTEAEPVSRTPLWRALHGYEGAERRWLKLRRSGATDSELREAISKEFGGQGSTTGPGLCEEHKGGAEPSVRLGRDPKVELSGAALLGAVRALLLIPKLKEETR